MAEEAKTEKQRALAATVKSSVKAVAEEFGLRVSGDFYETLDRRVTAEVERACQRAKENKRLTLMAQDI